MPVTLPLLGSEGFSQDPDIIMARLLQHAFLSDYSQSNIYAGSVTSIQYIISEHAQDPLALSVAMRKALLQYYSRYMEDVSVTFEQSDFFDPTDEAQMQFNLGVTGYMNNSRYELNRTLQVDSTQGTSSFMNAIEGE